MESVKGRLCLGRVASKSAGTRVAGLVIITVASLKTNIHAYRYSKCTKEDRKMLCVRCERWIIKEYMHRGSEGEPGICISIGVFSKD